MIFKKISLSKCAQRTDSHLQAAIESLEAVNRSHKNLESLINELKISLATMSFTSEQINSLEKIFSAIDYAEFAQRDAMLDAASLMRKALIQSGRLCGQDRTCTPWVFKSYEALGLEMVF